MYQYSCIGFYLLYTAEERLRNFGDQGLVVETTIITCYGDQIMDDTHTAY